jgi:DNA-binding beta-propeller fold protein YncE
LHALLRGSTRTGSRTTPSGATSFVSDESGGVETVLNAGGHRIATIQLGGEAGNVQYDAGSGRVLADVQTRNDIAVIDPRTNRIVRPVSRFPAAARRSSRRTRTPLPSTRARISSTSRCSAGRRDARSC